MRLSTLAPLAVMAVLTSCGDDASDDGSDEGAYGTVAPLSEFSYDAKFALPKPAFTQTTTLIATVADARYCDLKQKLKYFSDFAASNVGETFCDGTKVETGRRYRMTGGTKGALLARLVDDRYLVVTKCVDGGTKVVTTTDVTESVGGAYKAHQYYYGTRVDATTQVSVRETAPSLQLIERTATGAKSVIYETASSYDQISVDADGVSTTSPAISVSRYHLTLATESKGWFTDQVLGDSASSKDRQRKAYAFDGAKGAYLVVNEDIPEGGTDYAETSRTSEAFTIPTGSNGEAVHLADADLPTPLTKDFSVTPPTNEWECEEEFDAEVDLSNCIEDVAPPVLETECQ